MTCTKGAGSQSHGHVYPGQGLRRETIPVKSFIATKECGASTSLAEPCKANCLGIYSLGGSSLHGCCLRGSQLPLRFIRMLNRELEMLLGGCSGCGVGEGAMQFPAAALPSPITARTLLSPRICAWIWWWQQWSQCPHGSCGCCPRAQWVHSPQAGTHSQPRLNSQGYLWRPMHARVCQPEGCSSSTSGCATAAAAPRPCSPASFLY